MSFRDILGQQNRYIFGGSTGDTYEDIQRKRQMADALFGGRLNAPQTFGEGLTALGQAFAERRLRGQADEGERQGRQQFQTAFSRILGGQAARPPATQGGAPTSTAPMSSSSEGQPRSAPRSFSGTQQEFIQAMMPHAMRASERTGVDARLILAQSAIETGWGRHAPNNNFFGIKSHGQSGGGTFATTEYVNGQPVQIRDSFRGYEDMGASADGYADFLLQNPRYRPMMAAEGLDAQLVELDKSGYATDPNYSNMVGGIARGLELPSGPIPAAQAPARAGIDPGLVSLASNPWASPAQKAVLESMLSQQLEASRPPDPMDALRLRQAQLSVAKSQHEFDQMRNPQADPMDAIELERAQISLAKDNLELEQMSQPERKTVKGADGYLYYQDTGERVLPGVTQGSNHIITGEDAAGYGLDPSKSYNISMGPSGVSASQIGGGGTSVTVNNNDAPGATIGTIPQGFSAVKDPSHDSGYRMVAIPGGPKDTSAQDAIAQANRERSGDVVIEDIDRVIGMLDNGGLPSTGMIGSVMARVPETDAHDTAKLLETIKANVGFDRLQQMREASPTGGALGAVSETEMRLLNSALGSLEQSQSPAQFRHNLTRLRGIYSEIVHGPGQGDAGVGKQLSFEELQGLYGG